VLPEANSMLARSIQCYLLLGTRLFQQSMRNVLGPLLVYMSKDLEIGIEQKGTILSAIAAGYFFTQVPGGALADRLGAKNVMTTALALSACCCLLVPWVVDRYGLGGLWVVIAIMGAVQGPLFPTSTVFLSRWMPAASKDGPDEKAWGTSMLDIGISVGSLVIIPIANTLAEAVGWRHTYHIVGFGSLGFVVLWQFLAADSPAGCWYISQDELTYIRANIPPPKSKGSSSAGSGVLGMPVAVAMHPGLWAVFLAHIAFNFGAYYMTNWNPTYYVDVLGLTPAASSIHLAMPHVTNLAVKALNPTMVNAVQRRGLSLLASRRIFTCLGFVCAGACLLPVYRLRSFSPWVSTLLFSGANACFGLAPSGFKSNYLDITEQYVGVVSGYGNTLGTVASWIGPQLVAELLRRFQSWDIVLGTVAVVNALASVNYAINSVVKPIESLVGTDAKAK